MNNGINFDINNRSDQLNYPDQDFLPFACYFDKTTILTKNGELLKTIKIPNYIDNTTKLDLFDIRERIREAIYKSSKRDNLSFWFHTVRRKIDLVSTKQFDNVFARNIDILYVKKKQWDHQYINDLYITIVIAKEHKNFLNLFNFLTNLSYTTIKNEQLRIIKSLANELQVFTKSIYEDLTDFGLQILSLKKDNNNIYYSEHLKFFSLLCNLEEKDFKVQPNNLSEILINKKIAYGRNIIEVNKNAKKQFCSLFSIKAHAEFDLVQLDKLLQMPQEFIVTQFTGYCDNKLALNKYQAQIEALRLSENADFNYISGLEEFVDADTNRNTDYSLTQTTIMLIAKTTAELEQNAIILHKVLNKIGLATTRENLFMPTLFWSQLPANFNFLKRFDIVPSYNIGGFASLYNFPIGKLNRNHWGDSICILKTALKTPFFYNFHYEKNGNTLIVGPKGSGKTTMMNFLISQANKNCSDFFYIDCNRKSEVFVNAMNGKYYGINKQLDQKRKKFSLNPIGLLKDKNNKEFLINWLTLLATYKEDNDISPPLKLELEKIPKILENIFKKSDSIKSLSDLSEFFNIKETKIIYENLKVWKGSGQLAFAFDNPTEDDFAKNKIGFDLSVFAKNKIVLAAAAYYIIYMISKTHDEKPTILAIDDAWMVFDNFVLGSKFINIMKELSSKNIAVILTTGGSYNINSSFIKQPLNNVFGSEIFLANKKTTDYQNVIFNIAEDESKMLNLMKERERNFLVKATNSIIIASNNLSDLKEKLLVLNNNNISINAMKKAMDLTDSNDSEVWLPVFYKILGQYDKQAKERRIKEQEEKQLKWEQEHIGGNNTQKRIIKNGHEHDD
jgi:type IV secretion system protein VirB4